MTRRDELIENGYYVERAVLGAPDIEKCKNRLRIPEQDHAQAWLSVCEHELPEVLVFGQQNPTIAHRKRSNFVVRRLRVRIGDRREACGQPACRFGDGPSRSHRELRRW